jgi:hypothetical protein
MDELHEHHPDAAIWLAPSMPAGGPSGATD